MFLDFKGIFFVVVCAITVVSLIVIKNKKRYLLFLLVLFFPFSTGIIFYRFHGIMLTDFPLLILIFMLAFDKKKFNFPKETFFILILVAWALFFSSRASYPGFSISESLRFFRGILVFLVIVNGVRNTKDLQAVVNAIFIGLAFQGLLALYQWRFGYLGLSFLGETSWVSWRTKGTFQHESYFGNYLVMTVPLAFRMFVFYKPPKKSEARLNGILLFIGGMALFTSMTRGPWVSFVLAVAAMVAYSLVRKKLRPKVLAPIIFMIVGILLFFIRYLPNIMSQFGEDRMKSADIRMPLNRVALRAVKDNWIYGVGMGNYTYQCYKYVVPESEPQLEDWHIEQLRWDVVHNSYLLIAAESGVLGGFMFLLFFFFMFIRGRSLISKAAHPYYLNLAIGIMTCLFAVFIAFQFSPDIRIHQINTLFFLLSGLILAISNINRNQIRMARLRAPKLREEKYRNENIRNL